MYLIYEKNDTFLQLHMKHLLLNLFLKVPDKIGKKFRLQPIFGTYQCLNNRMSQRTLTLINNTTHIAKSILKHHHGY